MYGWYFQNLARVPAQLGIFSVERNRSCLLWGTDHSFMHAFALSALNGGVKIKTYDKLKDEINFEDDGIKPLLYSVKFTAIMKKNLNCTW